MTDEEKIVQEIKALNSQSEASSADQCPAILQTQSWCSIVRSATRTARPEWDELLPQTKFFVVEYALIGQGGGQLRHLLVAKQNGQHYDVANFDQLLNANGIVITDTNREQVAKAFVLMSLDDYIEQDIVFFHWVQGDWPASFDDRFSHSVKVWTKTQGLRMQYFFAFKNGNLWEARRGLDVEYHIGSYIDVPFEQLPIPGFKQYWFHGR